jgi:hypothetical protein
MTKIPAFEFVMDAGDQPASRNGETSMSGDRI